AVGAVQGGPIHFTAFKGPVASFVLSAAIGITAGLSNADDTGRRYLIGVAAAVQLAIFPMWLGVASGDGVAGLCRCVAAHRQLSYKSWNDFSRSGGGLCTPCTRRKAAGRRP